MGKRFFISDFHFEDEAHLWERHQFKSEQEHTTNLLQKIGEWADKLNKDTTNEIWVLGDYGSTDYLWAMDAFDCKKVFVYGNHDKVADLGIFELYFDEVYLYPTFLNQTMVVSHYPEAVWNSQINIHGHLHKAKIADPRYICCSVDDRDYKLVSQKDIDKAYSQIPKFQMKFLWEPYAEALPQKVDLTEVRQDLVYNPVTGILDIAASRVFHKDSWVNS